MKYVFVFVFCGLSLPAQSADVEVAEFGYRIVNVYPHDKNAFTQGLFFRDGVIYESTGLRGFSSIRSVSLATGEIVRKYDLAPKYFGEGIVDWGDRLISVTWRANRGFVFAIDDFEEQSRFSYDGEGWGLTRDESNIIMSDGTERIRFLDPDSFAEIRSITVTLRGRKVRNINELEWIEGEIYSNVWQTDRIIRIDPESGIVTGVIDLSGLLPASDRILGHTDVLNGIAYDAESKRMFVTGKNWPKLFEIELVEKPVSN